MNITELKEGQGIIFKTENEKERILPILHSIGYTNLFDFNPAVAASKMTGAPLYVNIEANKKLAYSTAKNFKVVYLCSEDISIPYYVKHIYNMSRLGPQFATASRMGGFDFTKESKFWTSVYTNSVLATGGIVDPKTSKPYKISAKDALTLIQLLPEGSRLLFKSLWGHDLMDGKDIEVSEATKLNYLSSCFSRDKEDAEKLFKVQCPYKDDELILVKHFESYPWLPKFFYKMAPDGSVWCHGIGSTTPKVYKFHCNAKVSPE